MELSKCLNTLKDGIAEHALSVAVFILLMIESNDIKVWQDVLEMKTFFQAFLIQADYEKRTCPNFDLMMRNFPEKSK